MNKTELSDFLIGLGKTNSQSAEILTEFACAFAAIEKIRRLLGENSDEEVQICSLAHQRIQELVKSAQSLPEETPKDYIRSKALYKAVGEKIALRAIEAGWIGKPLFQRHRFTGWRPDAPEIIKARLCCGTFPKALSSELKAAKKAPP